MMLCDELKYENLGDMMPFYPRSTLVIRKQFVDAAIAELKEFAEDACLERDDNQNVIDELQAENRRLKRALWLARAGEASKEVNYWTCQDESSYAIVDFNVRHETIVSYKAPHHRPYKWILIWEEVERKCRAKAEEYK